MDQKQVTRPFFYESIAPKIHAALSDAKEKEKEHLQIVLNEMDCSGNRIVAATKPLNRYSILPGKTFSSSAKSKEKYKILRLVADDVVVQNTKSLKVETVQINKLLKNWSDKGFQEVSLLDEIIDTVKTILGPTLGIFLTTALIAWLTEKLMK
jgi:hypothetical protein